MRVIAGRYKGRRLTAPKGKDIRPTTDKTKEAIFSILMGRIPGAFVLDLFSGTGALGIEALSRGATACIFCEQTRPALDQIDENLRHCDIAIVGLREITEESDEPAAALCPGDALRSMENIKSVDENIKFDIILMDPPYGEDMCEKVLEKIADNDLLAPDGIIVCEHGKNEIMPDEINGFTRTKERRYGISKVSIYRHTISC